MACRATRWWCGPCLSWIWWVKLMRLHTLQLSRAQVVFSWQDKADVQHLCLSAQSPADWVTTALPWPTSHPLSLQNLSPWIFFISRRALEKHWYTGRNETVFYLMHRMTELVTMTPWGRPCQHGWAFIVFNAMVEIQWYLVILSCKTDLLTISLPVVQWNRWFPEKLFTD